LLKTQVNIDFSYKLTLNNEATIYLGLKGGLNSFKANTEELVAYNNTPDPAKTNLSRINPNISVGLLFKHKTSWVSAALPRLFNTKRSNEIFINARDRVHFYFAAGTAYPIKENFQLEPRLIYRTVQGIKSTVETALWANYKQRFSFGIGLRTGAATSFKMKLDMSETISLSYVYDTYGNLNSNLPSKYEEMAAMSK
jgi:type IX secretion system PorP/SprF family membrane protein